MRPSPCDSGPADRTSGERPLWASKYNEASGGSTRGEGSGGSGGPHETVCAPQLNATRRCQEPQVISEQAPQRHSSGQNADTNGEPLLSEIEFTRGHGTTLPDKCPGASIGHSDLAALQSARASAAHWEPLAARRPPRPPYPPHPPLLQRIRDAVVRADGPAPPHAATSRTVSHSHLSFQFPPRLRSYF